MRGLMQLDPSEPDDCVVISNTLLRLVCGHCSLNSLKLHRVRAAGITTPASGWLTDVKVRRHCIDGEPAAPVRTAPNYSLLHYGLGYNASAGIDGAPVTSSNSIRVETRLGADRCLRRDRLNKPRKLTDCSYM